MGKKNKKIKDKQRAKFKAENDKSKEAEKSIQYVCTECGEEELIPEGVVEYFDIMDDGDIAEPPTFSCEKCGAIMKPKKYEGVHGITYEF
jgi:DNA-directed RNA polymerase subunit M/transcription elongation factor TFIIS